MKLLVDSDSRKTQNEKQLKEAESEEEDEDDIKFIQEESQTEEQLHLAIAELLGSLLKTHQELAMNIANYVYKVLIPKTIQPNLSDAIHQFAIYLIDDMVEHIGYALCLEYWPSLLQGLQAYAADKNCEVR